jgi:hypothetical protein
VDGKEQLLREDDWKDIFTASLRKHQRIAQGLDGGVVLLGLQTSRLSIEQMADLITLIEAFGFEHNVKWTIQHENYV